MSSRDVYRKLGKKRLQWWPEKSGVKFSVEFRRFLNGRGADRDVEEEKRPWNSCCRRGNEEKINEQAWKERRKYFT